MDRLALIKATREILTRAGFYTSDLCSMGLTGFDMIARRDEDLIIVKVLSNIDSLTGEIANEIRVLSKLLNAQPLLIGDKNGSGKLEDGVVYFRFGVQSITAVTLADHLLEGMPIHVYASPGGFYVDLDHERIKRLRKEKELSLGAFARVANISRRAVQMYEDGMNARVEVAIRMEELLDEVITKEMELIKRNRDPPSSKVVPLNNKMKIDQLGTFQRNVLFLLEHMGYSITPVGRCPFEAVSKDDNRVILTCVHRDKTHLDRRAQVVASISRITEKHAVLITDKETSRQNVKGTPVVSKKELKKTLHPDDFLNLILERL